MMKTRYMIFAMAVLFLACKKEAKELSINDILVNDTGLVIKYGTYTGWFMGNDSLVITSTDLWFNSSCDKKQSIKHGLISVNDYQILLNKLDLKEFKKVELNSCNVCLDGSDDWISVKNGTYFHSIRYGYSDSLALRKIEPFIQELVKIKSEMQ
jgi:hypothetical protein